MTGPSRPGRPLPHGRTARRLEWGFLPPATRAAVERRLGSPVVGHTSRDSGFTPGFASVLRCADGTRHFVKGAAVTAQAGVAAAYRDEIATLRRLPPDLGVPALEWCFEDDWLVFATTYVDGRPPLRPWRTDELDRCLDALEELARVDAAGLELPSVTDEVAAWPGLWEVVAQQHPHWSHLDEAASLAAAGSDALTGTTLVHHDVRDDNVILADDGRVWLCDWTWPARGPGWLDSLHLLIGAAVDDVPVDQILTRRAVFRGVSDEAIDAILALVAGFLLKHAAERVPPTSPHLRAHQATWGHAAWSWLARRRGWAATS